MTLKHLAIFILILLFAVQKLFGSTISEKCDQYKTEHREKAQIQVSAGDTA